MMERIWKALGAIEESGKPSSTRIHAIWWSMICTVLVIAIFWHLIHLADTARLSIWLANIPIIIFSLIALMQSGYAINQGAGAISSLADVLSKKRDEK